MTRAHEDSVERTLRWMTENLMGAYTAVHPPGHPNAGKSCTNSGTCILALCYMNALGKVILKGGPPKRGPSRQPRPDFVRFQAFIKHCMPDFITESTRLPPTPRGHVGGDEWLYEVFRCGFVHGYPPGVAWGRGRHRKKYWLKHRPLTLNIDELVRGFQRGLVEFRKLVAADPELRARFREYIVAE